MENDRFAYVNLHNNLFCTQLIWKTNLFYAKTPKVSKLIRI